MPPLSGNAVVDRPVVRADARWHGGWFAPARRIDSPHQDRRPARAAVDLVVLHSISLPPGQFGGDAVERLFTGRLDPQAHPSFGPLRGLRVSAHFVVRRDGELLQFVSCARRAWHAGVSAWQGRDRCNDFSVGIELEGLEHHPFEAVQYDVLDALLKAVARRYPIRAVQGHEHVSPGRKQDPGRAFDWKRVAAALPRCECPETLSAGPGAAS